MKRMLVVLGLVVVATVMMSDDVESAGQWVYLRLRPEVQGVAPPPHAAPADCAAKEKAVDCATVYVPARVKVRRVPWPFALFATDCDYAPARAYVADCALAVDCALVVEDDDDDDDDD